MAFPVVSFRYDAERLELPVVLILVTGSIVVRLDLF